MRSSSVSTRSKAQNFLHRAFTSDIYKELLDSIFKPGSDWSLGLMIDFVSPDFYPVGIMPDHLLAAEDGQMVLKMASIKLF